MPIFLRPKKSISNARIDVMAIIAAIGTAEFAVNMPTATEARAPIPSCIAPIKDDAVPALRENGANERAAAFGFVRPTQHKKRNINP